MLIILMENKTLYQLAHHEPACWHQRHESMHITLIGTHAEISLTIHVFCLQLLIAHAALKRKQIKSIVLPMLLTVI